MHLRVSLVLPAMPSRRIKLNASLAPSVGIQIAIAPLASCVPKEHGLVHLRAVAQYVPREHLQPTERAVYIVPQDFFQRLALRHAVDVLSQLRLPLVPPFVSIVISVIPVNIFSFFPIYCIE